MIAKAFSCALLGLEAVPIQVEVGILRGLPDLIMVGLPDTAVRESKERVRAAIGNAGFQWPCRRILVNLAPAHIRKEGSGFDLAVAAGILKASGQLEHAELEDYVFAAELSIDGSVKPIRGILPIAMGMAAWPQKTLVISEGNLQEALYGTERVAPIHHLSQTAELKALLKAKGCNREIAEARTDEDVTEEHHPDLFLVAGQQQARRALEIAAAGRHNLLMTGPPGSGKSLLAQCLPTLLPPLSWEEAIAVNRIYSAAGLLSKERPWIRRRPFRSPHIHITRTGMIGGGVPFQPGEISLAQHGVLYLDEISEVSRTVLECLRQPAEEGRITLSRNWGTLELPADFQLVGTSNPCYCGYYGDSRIPCRCSAYEINRYRNKLSGPMLDRIDLRISVPRVEGAELQWDEGLLETSAQVRQRVRKVWEIQRLRRQEGHWDLKGLLHALTPAARQALGQVYDRQGMTARGCSKLLRIARTIADLSGDDSITAETLAEAVHYRG